MKAIWRISTFDPQLADKFLFCAKIRSRKEQFSTSPCGREIFWQDAVEQNERRQNGNNRPAPDDANRRGGGSVRFCRRADTDCLKSLKENNRCN
jgi:hypothetical protein